MNLQPINDRILVRLFEHPSEEQKIGSIIVPEMAREKENICGSQVYMDKPTHRGTVVAVGPGPLVQMSCANCRGERLVRKPLTVKVGDVVIFGRFYDLCDEDMVMLREDDILGTEAGLPLGEQLAAEMDIKPVVARRHKSVRGIAC